MEQEKFNWKRLLITLVIVILTAGAVGGSVYYVMDKQLKEDQTASEKTAQELQKKIDELRNSDTTEEDNEISETEDENIYKISELNLQFTVDDSIGDLMYKYGSTYSSAEFTTESLVQYGDACKVTGQPLGIIYFTTNAPLKVSDPNYSPNRSENAVVKTIGNKYLYYLHPQATCSDTKSVQDLQSSQTTKLQEALKTAELIN